MSSKAAPAFSCLFVVSRTLILCKRRPWLNPDPSKKDLRAEQRALTVAWPILHSCSRLIWIYGVVQASILQGLTFLQPYSLVMAAYISSPQFSPCALNWIYCPDIFFFSFFVSKLYLIDRFNPGCPDPALSIIRAKPVPAEGRGAIKSPAWGCQWGTAVHPKNPLQLLLFF